MYLSDLLGRPLSTPDSASAGVINDVVVKVAGIAAPSVVGLLIRHTSTELFLPVAALDHLTEDGAQATQMPRDAFRRRPDELLLGRDVMDSQVIDLRGPRVVRVNDVVLAETAGQWQVSGVDIGLRAVFRRLLPRALHIVMDETSIVPWSDCELLASEVPGGGVRPDHQRLARLHPADIARVVDAIPTRQAGEVVSYMTDELAADTMEEMADAKQADVLEILDPDRAADILEQMAPDAVADVLAEMEPELVNDVLRRMDPVEAADVHALLTYPHDTAGGLMTTDYVWVPLGLTVSEAGTYLRPQLGKPDWVYYIYVVEETKERRLVGVFTLRDLFLADPEQRLDELMMSNPRTVGPQEKAATVAQIMSDYNLMALPVVDPTRRLLGIVSVDDALEIILPTELRRQIPRVFH